jgi:broad specificity phosphatase PhoE
MAGDLPKLYLVRHGDTAWTESRQHTGRTDIELNERGIEHARQLGELLRSVSFARVFTSPLQRAAKTCELAGFGSRAVVDIDLLEWDYGRFEGKHTPEILAEQPRWRLFFDGCPNGESPADVAARADRFIAKVHAGAGDVLAFSSGHIIRMIAARWLNLPADAGRFFFCDPASVGILGFEHQSRDQPTIHLWNSARQPGE